MPRNSVSLAIAAWICAGCAARQPAVFVDLSRVEALPPAAVQSGTEGVLSTGAVSEYQASLLPFAGNLEEQGVPLERLVSARADLEDNRARALRGLEDRLFRSYQRELDGLAAEQAQEWAEWVESVTLQADSDLRARFEQYGFANGPLLARVAFLTRFPLPDVAALPDPPIERVWARMRIEEARFKFDLMKGLEEGYRQDVERNERWMEEQLDAKRLAQSVRLTEQTSLYQERARSEASVAFQSTAQDFESRLAESSVLPFPQLPTGTVRLESTNPSTVPRWGREPVTSQRDPREELDHDLSIWARLRGFRLVSNSREGRNATTEFLEWRKSRRLGP